MIKAVIILMACILFSGCTLRRVVINGQTGPCFFPAMRHSDGKEASQ